MWKDIRRIVVKLLVLLLPFFILLPLYCRFFPNYYLDEEYAMYKQQYDYVMAEDVQEEADVLIIGDSRAKAAFSPELLSDGDTQVYNLALGGTTAIEGYYTLKNYLEHHEKPQKVVVCYAPMHYMDVDTLWTRCIYFHTLKAEDFKDLMTQAERFADTEKVLVENYRLEYLMYELYLPNKYATALKNSAFVTRKSATTQKYADMAESKGHTFYGTAEYSDGIDGEAKVDDFTNSDIITWYLKRLIALGRQQGIEIIIEQAPVNETSYGIFTPSFKEHFRSFMNELAEENPDVKMYTDFYCYPNECFGDADHLNAAGVAAFSEQMRQGYGW